ncbi:MAG TPA: hypothetical protein VGK38_05010 [Prolixibacteraceae bacterium]|jgi:hypothetical protein
MKNSPYSEDELLEIAAKFKRHLKDHFNDLNNVCPDLDQEFIFKFKALFYEVQAHPLEPEVNKTTQDFKLYLEDIGNQVRGLFPIFRFYLQKAFPYDSSLWEAYEYCQIESAVHDYSTLRICLKESVKIIEEKKIELRAANCPDPTLREIESLSKQVNGKYEELLEYQKVKDLKKKVYYNNMNELFKSMKMVDEAASKCYQNNPELLIKLTFPPKHRVPQK